MRLMPRICAFVFLAMMLAVPVSAFARDAFVGTWKITVTPDNDAFHAGQKEYKDTLTFKGMQFTSAVFKAHGFESAQYDEDTRGGIAATFTCELKSKKNQGTANWSGMSTGVDLTGEMTWKKPDGTKFHYTFKGTRQ